VSEEQYPDLDSYADFPQFPSFTQPGEEVSLTPRAHRPCRRIGPVSGRYEGEMPVWPRNPRNLLDLRVDIDRRYPNSAVLNRVSGDFLQAYPAPQRPYVVYRESWIVNNPRISWSGCQVVITGRVEFWEGTHPDTEIILVIPWQSLRPPSVAYVTFTEGSNSGLWYICPRKSHCFRDVNLEVDIAASVNAAPILPSYHTHAHLTRPSDIPGRVLDIEEAYRETGICMSIRPERTVIDDSASGFVTWSADELHDALETHFSQFPGTWPKWELWGLLCGEYDDPLTGGIMFDYFGPAQPPERQGFAVFRNHQWFNNLVAGTPTNQDQAWAMRQFLYTYVHEAGHAFNFVHSWNKGRPNALSWMNYPQRVTNFWQDFRFLFDDDELVHIRHGKRSSVIMGGDPWGSGSHLRALPPGVMSQLIEGEPTLELLLRSKDYFEYMEPVEVEIRLRNVNTDSITVDTRLGPEYGVVMIFIMRPNGAIVNYTPIVYKEGVPILQTLKSKTGSDIAGEDRYSQNVNVTYGKHGFYFSEPGEYLVRAMYQPSDDMLILSNVLPVRIQNPTSKEESEVAQKFFTYEVGMSLYLNGSQSPFLSSGKEVLESVSDRFGDTLLGAKASKVLAEAEARPFFRVQDQALKQTHSPDYSKALKLTEPALEVYKSKKQKALNISYHNLVQSRVNANMKLGKTKDAQSELLELRKDLDNRGVNQSVLRNIESLEESTGKPVKRKGRKR
jgi:hypothetical protein